MPDVLVVEDNAVNRKLVGVLLARAGYSFATVEDGIQALERLRREPFRVVLMDMMMPVMNGYEATRLIRSEPGLGGIAIIALTANALSGEEARCRAAGCSDFVTKPYTKDRILAAIAAALDETSAR